MYNLYINIFLIFFYLKVNIIVIKFFFKYYNIGICVIDYLRKCVWLVIFIEGKVKLEKFIRFCILMFIMFLLVFYFYSMIIV